MLPGDEVHSDDHEAQSAAEMSRPKHTPKTPRRRGSAPAAQRNRSQPSDRAAPHRNSLKRSFDYIRRLYIAYETHQCSLLACACSYCALLSLVPLLVVGIAALGFIIGGSEEALNRV